MRLRAALLAGLLVSTSLLFAAPTDAATGDVLRVFSGPCFGGNGRAVGYANGNLYYTVYGSTTIGIAKTSGACVGTKNPGVNFGALTWDPGRQVFWAGSYDGNANVYTWDPATNTKVLKFNAKSVTGGDGSCCPGYIDGLAYDQGTDSLWYSNDLAFSGTQKIFQLSLTGTVLKTFTVSGGNSGIAFDGVFLWLSFPLVPEIRKYAVPATSGTSPAPVASFRTGSYLVESMTFDLDTFAPKCAVWGNGATFGANPLVAFEIPCPATAIGDAWTVTSTNPLVDVHEHGRAYADKGNNAVDNTSRVVVAGPATVTVGANHAESKITSRFPSFSGSANGRSTLLDVNVGGGMVKADAVIVTATSTANNGAYASAATGEILGLRIAGGPPQDVMFTGAPVQNVTLPNGAGYVSLFEVEKRGSATASEIRVTAIHVYLAGQTPPSPAPAVAASETRVGVAWSAVSGGDPLLKHPVQQGPFGCLKPQAPPLPSPVPKPPALPALPVQTCPLTLPATPVDGSLPDFVVDNGVPVGAPDVRALFV